MLASVARYGVLYDWQSWPHLSDIAGYALWLCIASVSVLSVIVSKSQLMRDLRSPLEIYFNVSFQRR